MKKFIGRFAPILLVVALCSPETTSAYDCHTAFVSAYLDQCDGNVGGGMRSKRELTPPEIQLQEIKPGTAQIEISEYRYPSKRELPDPGAAIASVAGPMISDAITSALTRRSYMPPVGKYATPVYPYPIAASYAGPPQYYIAAAPPPPAHSIGRGFLPQASGDDLGFDLTEEEMERIFDEVAQRITRTSPVHPEKKRAIIQQASKCCKNEKRCQMGEFKINCPQSPSN